MKKIISFFLVFLFILSILGCSSTPEGIPYSDDNPFVLSMKGDHLKILQLTDLHLLFGIDYEDRQTFRTIEVLVQSDEFDLVVITGDLTMSPSAPRLFRQLIRFMETLKTPWTFVFGNHEADFNSYDSLLAQIPSDSEYLVFKVGPQLEEGGFGNFRIQFNKGNQPFQMLYFLDSHAERSVYTEEEGKYDYLKPSQVAWYDQHVQNDFVNSLLFMHMPLRQYLDFSNITGRQEEGVYPQGRDTGMFDKIVQNAKTKGVFVGHDHLNDFSFLKEGVLLAYGLITGHNAYGSFDQGGRIIIVSDTGELTSYVRSRNEVLG